MCRVFKKLVFIFLLLLILSLFLLFLSSDDFADWLRDFAQQSFEAILLSFARFAFDVLSVASLNLRRCLNSTFELALSAKLSR